MARRQENVSMEHSNSDVKPQLVLTANYSQLSYRRVLRARQATKSKQRGSPRGRSRVLDVTVTETLLSSLDRTRSVFQTHGIRRALECLQLFHLFVRYTRLIAVFAPLLRLYSCIFKYRLTVIAFIDRI